MFPVSPVAGVPSLTAATLLVETARRTPGALKADKRVTKRCDVGEGNAPSSRNESDDMNQWICTSSSNVLPLRNSGFAPIFSAYCAHVDC